MQVIRNWAVVFMLVMLSGETPAKPVNPKAEQVWQTPCDSIIRDLRDFLPGYMENKHIPGCALSLICDHRIILSEGFGSWNSNLGYTYLQQMIEQLTGKPLEELAAALVFEPMGMPGTSYINKREPRMKPANGHVTGRYLLGLSGTFFLISMLLSFGKAANSQKKTKKFIRQSRLRIWQLFPENSTASSRMDYRQDALHVWPA